MKTVYDILFQTSANCKVKAICNCKPQYAGFEEIHIVKGRTDAFMQKFGDQMREWKFERMTVELGYNEPVLVIHFCKIGE